MIDGAGVIVVAAHSIDPYPGTPGPAAAALLYGQLAAAVRDQTVGADLALPRHDTSLRS